MPASHINRILFAEKPLERLMLIRPASIDVAAWSRTQVNLHQEPDVVGPAMTIADRIDAITIINQRFETVVRRMIQNAPAHTGEPGARLFFPGEVTHIGNRSIQ